MAKRHGEAARGASGGVTGWDISGCAAVGCETAGGSGGGGGACVAMLVSCGVEVGKGWLRAGSLIGRDAPVGITVAASTAGGLLAGNTVGGRAGQAEGNGPRSRAWAAACSTPMAI